MGKSPSYYLFHSEIELIAITGLSFLQEFVIGAYRSEVKRHELE